jgi:hypothetical protein
MVARLFPAAHLTVDAGRDQAIDDRRAEKQLIDPEARIAARGISKVAPERVDPLIRMEFAQCDLPGRQRQPSAGAIWVRMASMTWAL